MGINILKKKEGNLVGREGLIETNKEIQANSAMVRWRDNIILGH